MTKEELVAALKAAVGGTAYGDAIVDEAAATYDDKDKKYGQDMKTVSMRNLVSSKLTSASIKMLAQKLKQLLKQTRLLSLKKLLPL